MNTNDLISLNNIVLFATEHDSSSKALKYCDLFLKEHDHVLLLEVIPLLTGAYVCIFVSTDNLLSPKPLLPTPSQQVLLTQVQTQTLRTLYHLHTPKQPSSIAVFETSSFLQLIEIIYKCSFYSIEILDHKNSRGFLKNQIIIGSDDQTLKKFHTEHNSSIQNFELIINPQTSLIELFCP